MAKVAFILLTHKDPEAVIRQAERLSSAGDFVSVHFDGRAPAGDFARIRRGLAANPRVAFARRRVSCGWGEWSLVEATLEALRAAIDAFPQATHFYLLSGDCMPVKSAEYVHGFLDAADVDHIESLDFYSSGWIRTGLVEERLHYRHVFNERRHKWLFEASLGLQRRLGLSRRPPEDVQMMIGSQWWCLRRATVARLLAFCTERPDVLRFFRTTWIPDETFFQTLVRHLVPDEEIRTRPLTFLLFTDYGMPVVFCNDHLDLLVAQDHLFARKISADAAVLRARLWALWTQAEAGFRVSDGGGALFRFVTSRGRLGHRFAPRFWETEASLGRDRVLMILVCKKWHVAKRLARRISARAQVPAVGYLFSEEGGMPDLGGIERTLEKRNRHRKALLRMLFDYFRSDRLVICVDPAGFDLLRDFTSDKAETRILEIRCDFSDGYLAGHAQRVGLVGRDTPREILERILPTLRADLRYESDRMSDAGFARFERIHEGAGAAEAAQVLARFLDVPPEVALALASGDDLFAD
ncbi:DUF5928 domain-containing protein [Paenirhodobacter sp.]|uniref:DUF5928 domain-containing protein n=1 Tax=Paenirhodobacter sp. TaxID=1965326 RepID=UPI003B3C3B1D